MPSSSDLTRAGTRRSKFAGNPVDRAVPPLNLVLIKLVLDPVWQVSARIVDQVGPPQDCPIYAIEAVSSIFAN